jgi:hypothetical protein
MKKDDAKLTQNQVFSHPIRKLNAAELEKVLGGSGHLVGFKATGGTDNQGKRH